MTLMSNYDLERAIFQGMSFGMESDQDIEINAEEVIINADNTIDGELEDLSENTSIVAETSDNIEKVEQAEATLESLIANMNDSLLIGGYDRRTATVANIALESISTRFGLQVDTLNFGLEEVTEDGEAETRSTLDKAKGMLSALGQNAGALLNKMYGAVAAALGSITELSAKLIAAAQQLKSKINKDNDGKHNFQVKKKVMRKLTLDGHTALDPKVFVKEFNRLTSKYNNVVKAYNDTDILSKFISDTAVMLNGKESPGTSKDAVRKVREALKEGLTKKVKSGEGEDIYSSEPYLGGMRITAKRASVAQVKKMINEMTTLPSAETVSQEASAGQHAVGTGVGLLKAALGSLMVFTGTVASFVGFTGVVGSGVVMVNAKMFAAASTKLAADLGMAGVATVTGGSVVGSGLALLLISALTLVAATYGVTKGIQLIKNGFLKSRDNVVELFNKGRSALASKMEEAAEDATEFDVVTSSVSTESDTEAKVGLQALDNNQTVQVLDTIIATSGSTQNLKAELKKRKALIGEIDKITKAINDENKESGEGNPAIVKMYRDFIKKFIKSSIKFELDLANYTVGVMKAAYDYVNLSNNLPGLTQNNADDAEKE